jgi:hypothetical protein
VNALEQLQQNAFDRLANDLSMATVVVLSEKKGDRTADLAQTLASNTKKGGLKGAVVLVCGPFFDVDHMAAPGPRIEPSFYVRCIERPITNRGTGGTGISAEQLAINVVQLLHNYIMQDLYVTTTAHRGDPVIYEGGEREYTVTIKTSLQLSPLSKCAMPFISGNSETQVTITCATPGAIIYWTTDGSYPCPGNPHAQLCPLGVFDELGNQILSEDGRPLQGDSPVIPVAFGASLRAVAFNQPNQVASDLAAQTIQ